MTLFSRLVDGSAGLQSTDYLLADVGNPPVTKRVTVASVGAATAAQPDALALNLVGASNLTMNGDNGLVFQWTTTVLSLSSHASWDANTNTLTLVTPGTYEITLRTNLARNEGASFDQSVAVYGVQLANLNLSTVLITAHTITNSATGTPPSITFVNWSDSFLVQTDVSGSTNILAAVYANTYDGGSQTCSVRTTVLVKYVSPSTT